MVDAPALPGFPAWVFSRGAAVSPDTLGEICWILGFFAGVFVGGDLFLGPRRWRILLAMTFHVDCTTNHVFGGRAMSTFVKHVFLDKSFGVINIVGNSVGNYIERCSQSTKGVGCGTPFEGIMIL